MMTDKQLMDVFASLYPDDAVRVQMIEAGADVDTISAIGARSAWSHFKRSARAVLAADRDILLAVWRELDGVGGGNAPGHAHRETGIWDEDNGANAGKPCAWCLTWAKFTSLVTPAESRKNPA